MGFLTVWYAFPPNVSIEEVRDKGKHNFESRFSLKNIGKMPASNVILDVEGMNLKMGGINMTNMNTIDCGWPISSLASGEQTEIPAVPHVSMPVGTSLETCDYTLKIKYEVRLPYFTKKLSKNWRIELRNTGGGEFIWQVSLA